MKMSVGVQRQICTVIPLTFQVLYFKLSVHIAV